MRLPIALALGLAALPRTAAAEPGFAFGGHGGVLLYDTRDLPKTSWYATPRLGFWFNTDLGLELEVGTSTGRTKSPDDRKFTVITPALQLVVDPAPKRPSVPVRPILTAGLGMMAKKLVDPTGARDVLWRYEAMPSVGTGLVIPVLGALRVRLDTRLVIGAANQTDDFESPLVGFQATAGIETWFGIARDRDKDDVPDKLDQCPDETEDFDGFDDEDGCPDTDNDGDGVNDHLDGCDAEVEDVDGFEDFDGCPDPDNDGDGLPDVTDACPDEAGPAATHGCPAPPPAPEVPEAPDESADTAQESAVDPTADEGNNP